MDIIRNSLNILFHQISPKEVIKKMFDDNLYKTITEDIDKNMFLKEAYRIFSYYTEDELANIYRKLKKDMEFGKNSENPSIFNLLWKFTNPILKEKNYSPVCTHENLLRWKMTSHKLGQDILTTSYLAYKDTATSVNRHYFTWKPMVNSDNIRLKNMLKKGMAENHFHLKGSSITYNLSWINLMNNPLCREKDFKKAGMIDSRMNPDISYGANSSSINLCAMVKKAALIRLFLFLKLNEKDLEVIKKISIENLLRDEIDLLDIYLGDIKEEIDITQYEYGLRFNFDGYSDDVILDYAIPRNIISRNRNSNLILLGERRFLYMMFRKIYEEDRDIAKYSGLFYVYLLIKAKFRSELIQNNDRVGFKNFSDYQGRKTAFINNHPLYTKLLYNMAVSATMENQNIKHLEARIVPKTKETGIIKQINEIDNIIRNYKKLKCEKVQLQEDAVESTEKQNRNTLSEEEMDKFFYTLHFVKRPDPPSEDKLKELLIPRNYERRRILKQQVIAISNLREENNPVSKRVLGIDACSNEIGSRPEIFAQAFRYLKNHTGTHVNEHLHDNSKIPQIGATYHAGEDFLDIVDGLRAIDEVIKFLNFRQGDRLGHALALGINAYDYYNFKNNTLIMPKQDYLDNIVWLYAKIEEFNIDVKYSLLDRIKREYNSLFNEIYLSNMETNERKMSFNQEVYYDSWKLRGDDPCLYMEKCDDETGSYYKKKLIMTFWEKSAINYDYIPEDIFLRQNAKVSYLYHSYHFNPEIKLKGVEQMEVKVSYEYIEAVKKVQKKLQLEIANKGIAIECNPSSNYLIGTLKKYSEHPITNFFNLGLSNDQDEIKNCHQIFVSINTDDQGVFSTDLENEYALMAIALEKELDDKGERRYNQAMIYDWLDRIREMGIEQSFRANLE